jgi:hypothetical protein
MADTPQKKPPTRDWRFPLAIGLVIGLGVPIARAVEKNLEPSLGYWGALPFSALVTGVIGVIVALVVYWLIKPGGSDRA